MRIVFSGSIAYDYLMTFPGYFKEFIHPEKMESLSLSFLVDSLTRHYGGIAPNIAYNYALLGGKATVLGTAGDDFDEYRRWLESQIGTCKDRPPSRKHSKPERCSFASPPRSLRIPVR